MNIRHSLTTISLLDILFENSTAFENRDITDTTITFRDSSGIPVVRYCSIMGWGHFPTPEETARGSKFMIKYNNIFRAAEHAKQNEGYSFPNPHSNLTSGSNTVPNKSNTPPTEHAARQMISRYEQSALIDY